MVEPVTPPSSSRATSSEPQRQQLEDFYIGLEEIGLTELELRHARPVHLNVAQRAVYSDGSVYPVLTLVREREYTQYLKAFPLPNSDGTYVLLLRNGSANEGQGRGYFVVQHSGLLQETVRFVDEYSFEVSKVTSRRLGEDLPEDLHEYCDESNRNSAGSDDDVPVA